MEQHHCRVSRCCSSFSRLWLCTNKQGQEKHFLDCWVTWLGDGWASFWCPSESHMLQGWPLADFPNFSADCKRAVRWPLNGGLGRSMINCWCSIWRVRAEEGPYLLWPLMWVRPGEPLYNNKVKRPNTAQRTFNVDFFFFHNNSHKENML